MAEPLTLLGFGPSVYTRIVRMALIEMGLEAVYVEVNPFAETPDPALTGLNPVGRVPVLKHGAFTLSETGAILRYLDRISEGARLIPETAEASARMDQVIGLVDAHLYVPLVRKAFAQGVFRPMEGLESDPQEVERGVRGALPALDLLNRIAAEGRVLNRKQISLADIHLAPMMDYGLRVSAVQEACAPFTALMRWWDWMAKRPSLLETDPLR